MPVTNTVFLNQTTSVVSSKCHGRHERAETKTVMLEVLKGQMHFKHFWGLAHWLCSYRKLCVRLPPEQITQLQCINSALSLKPCTHRSLARLCPPQVMDAWSHSPAGMGWDTAWEAPALTNPLLREASALTGISHEIGYTQTSYHLFLPWNGNFITCVGVYVFGKCRAPGLSKGSQ